MFFLVISSSSKKIWPLLFSNKPTINLANVDLPEPLWPKTATKEPLSIDKEISSITGFVLSYEKQRFLISNLLMLGIISRNRKNKYRY